jgi:predicted nucleotidyltransferase
MNLESHKSAIGNICRELGVMRLGVFGSAASPDVASPNDVDVIVLFDREKGKMFDRYFSLKEQLEDIFNLPVDVVLEDKIKNPYFKQSIESSRVDLYGPQE